MSNIQAPQKGDYVIFQSAEAGSKATILIRVNTTTKDGVVQGRYEKDPHIKPVALECGLDQVILNLGKDPHPGSVYGKDLSFLYRKSVDIDHFGEMHLFTRVPKDVGAQLREQSAWLYKRLKALGLSNILNSGIVWEIVSKQTAGKYAGMYRQGKLNKDGELTSPPRILLTLDEETLKASSIDRYSYVLAHELGHAIHFQYIKSIDGLDAKWLDMYTDTVTPVKIPQSTVVEMREDLIKSGSTLSAFKSTLEEEQLEVFKVVLGEIRRTSRLSPRELDTLTQSDEGGEHIRRVWPNSSVYLSRLSPLITQYSLKNYHELFAETFAFHVMEKKVPTALQKLLDKTLSQVKTLAG